MNIDYETLTEDVLDGTLSQKLEPELTIGFRQMLIDGDRLPTASHFAAQIAEIIDRTVEEPLRPEIKFDLYQEILIACERARANVLGDPPVVIPPS